MMVVGHDYRRSFGIEFEHEGIKFVVMAGEDYVRRELGGAGKSPDLLEALRQHRQQLFEDALAHRELWSQRRDGMLQYWLADDTSRDLSELSR